MADAPVAIPPYRYALLAMALVLVGITVYHPHWNPLTGARNDLPTHMDDYVHWGRAQAALDQGTIAYGEPFAVRGSASEFEFRSELHERGYHAYLAALQDSTGLDWLVLWEFVPLAAALLLALTVFAIAETWGAGVEAVLWLAAIPTTLRFLGPGFMVPIAFSLPLFAAGIFALLHLQRTPRLVTLFLLLASLWSIHTMAALALSALIVVDALARIRRSIVESLLQLTLVALPFLVVWPYIEGFLGSRSGPQELPVALAEVRFMGPVIFVCAAIGCARLAGSRTSIRAGSTLALLFVALAWTAIARMVNGVDSLGIYDRSLMIMYVLAAIFAGVGIAWIRHIGLGVFARLGWTRAAPLLIALLLLSQGATVVTAVKPQLEQPFYRVLAPEQHDAYAEASTRLMEIHKVALVDGMSSMAFSTMTRRPLAFTFYPSTVEMPVDVQAFFASGASDTRYLVDHGITIVATERPVHNSDLRPIADGVYVLRDDYAARVAAAQAVLE